MNEELGCKEDITLSMFLGLRDIFIFSEPYVNHADLWSATEAVLKSAIFKLTEMRETEGKCMQQDLRHRIVLVNGYVDEIENRVPEVISEYQKNLRGRLRELTEGLALDDDRLHKEVAVIVDKTDITEEIVRFRAHVQQFCALIDSDEAVGRTVDFLIQEINREINTIGSKSNDIEIAKRVVEIKSELSKIREQVQNIE